MRVHCLHLMLVTLLAGIAVALALDSLIGGEARFAGLAAA